MEDRERLHRVLDGLSDDQIRDASWLLGALADAVVPAPVRAGQDGAPGVGRGRPSAGAAGDEPAVRQLGGVQPGAAGRGAGVTEHELLVELKRALTIALRAIEKRLEATKERTRAA